MPTRYDVTPPWGKKRKREPSVSDSSTNQSTSPPPVEQEDSKCLQAASHTSQRRPTPWAKYSDPLGPSSLAPLPKTEKGDNDDLQQAAKDMFDWTQSDRPAEDSLAHMERIVDLCQDESVWSGDKRWNEVVAAYKSCGATPDAVHDLRDAREPFWTQSRVKHASTTLATPKALADSIRTMLAESERIHGRYLDREVKNYLIRAVERVFPRTQPKMLIPEDGPKQRISESARQNSVSVAPVAQMTKNHDVSPQELVPAAPLQASSASSDLSRPPGWAPGSEKNTKPRADSLADALSSRKSSAATMIISSPLQPSLESPMLNTDSSEVVRPRRPTRFAPAPIEPASDRAQHTVPPCPSKLATMPIQFKIATGSNQAPLKRPRLETNVELPRKPTSDVFSTSSSPEHRRSSTLGNDVQPPTGPRNVPLFQAKIVVKEPSLGNIARQKPIILRACDINDIYARDATPCPSDDRTWILHFRTLGDLHKSLGRKALLQDIETPVLTYAPNQSFQFFGLVEKASLMTPKVEIDLIGAIAHKLHLAKFILRRQTHNSRYTQKWVVVFEEPLDRDGFAVDIYINGRRETLQFFGLDRLERAKRCWICAEHDHLAPSCANYTEVVKLPYKDEHYLWKTPQLK
jgi:hypothetical protein